MDESVRWLVGQIAACAAILFGYHKAMDAMVKKGDETLHSRINDVREQYVRRDDLRDFKEDVRSALDRIEKKLDKT